MEAIQSYPNLLSEKQAAARLGVARITLLRAREAGRIRFFRIGTRVLYSEEQLTEFLQACERNGHKDRDLERRPERHGAKRKDNRVSSPRKKSIDESTRTSVGSSSNTLRDDQVRLPFLATR